MKTQSPGRKRATNPSAEKRQIGLDAFGNAVPDVPAARTVRVVRTEEIPLAKGRKRKAVSIALVPSPPRLLERMTGWLRPRGGQSTAAVPAPIPTLEQRLEVAFRALHREFERRERQLDERLEVIREEQRALMARKSRRWLWAVPLGLVGALVVGYALYVLTSMQGSMVAMSGTMGTMAGDTRVMAENMGDMNRSMTSLNGNMGQMNQQMGTISQAAAPMGQAAQTMAPMTGMFRSFWPF